MKKKKEKSNEKVKKYTVSVFCRNCRKFTIVKIPLGIELSSFKCPNCETRNLIHDLNSVI